MLKHVAHTGRAHANEHFHKVRAGNGEERHLGFTGNRFRQQGFTGTRAAHHQHATRNAPTQVLEFGRIAQKIHQLGHFFLGFIATGHVGKRHAFLVFIQQARLAFTKRKRAILAAALHLTHEEHPYANQQQHGEPVDKQGHQEGLLFFGTGFNLDTVLQQIGHQPQIAGRVSQQTLVIRRGGTQGAAFNHHFGDMTLFDLVHEVGIVKLSLRGLTLMVGQAVEQRHQHQGDDQPDCNRFKIIHDELLKRTTCRGRALDYGLPDYSSIPGVPTATRQPRFPVANKYNSLLRSREALGLRVATR